MNDSAWHPFNNGSTLGQPCSEQGITIRDEEHGLGARITLERDAHSAPFAITCGLYGWMVHTRFFSHATEAQAQYEQMKHALSDLLKAAAESSDGGSNVLIDGVSRFVQTYP